MTQLYILPIEEAELISDEYCREHFPQRLKRAQKFRFKDDRLRCIGAGALLSGILGIKESDISCNEYGKPCCGGHGDFSISHSGKFIIMAVSEETVGADIEDMSRDHRDIAARVFLPDERAWMDASDDPRKSFFILWTLKESILKSEGKGLSMDPRGFSVLPLVKGGSAEIEGHIYYGESFAYEGHMISICSHSDKPAVRTLISSKML